ncbi:MAG: MlaD family protein [Chitinophagales bacterium]
MSLSKEVKTGILATASLGIFFVGFYFLKGASLFSNNKEYYCFYDDVDGLQNSANVLVRGLVVGHVSDMKLINDKGVKVTISINKKVEIPQGTVATIVSADFLGPKLISLKPGAGPGKLDGGATLRGEKEKGMLDNASGELTPRLQELKVTIAAIDTVLAGINDVLVPVKATANNLSALTGTLNRQSGEIAGITHNLNSFTANLEKQNDTIKQMMANLNSVSRQLANAPIQKTVSELQNTITQMKAIMDKINNNQGSLGLLINNKELYNNLNSSVISIQKLTDDVKAHPARYINVSIFGRKKN